MVGEVRPESFQKALHQTLKTDTRRGSLEEKENNTVQILGAPVLPLHTTEFVIKLLHSRQCGICFHSFHFLSEKVGVFLQSPETLENPGSIIENLKITENFECLLLSRHHIMVYSTLLQVLLANLDLGKEINALINMG